MSPSVRSKVGQTAKRAAATSLASSAVGLVDAIAARVDQHAPPTLAVLTYHRVGPADPHDLLAPTMLTADVESFRAQMDLVRDVATPVSMRAVVDAVVDGGSLPARAVLVTFDDGYRDFTDHAWPILVERALPAAMFVPTAFPGDATRRFWWDELWTAVVRDVVPTALQPEPRAAEAFDRLRALRDRVLSLPDDEAAAFLAEATREVRAEDADDHDASSVMGWDELRDLAADGLAIAAHTHTHAALHKLTPDEARMEIEQSIRELRDQGLGTYADVLAYPGGGHDERVRNAARQAGVRLAVTTDRGVNRLDRIDPLRVRRINVGRATSLALLRAQLVPSLARSARWTGDAS